MESENGVPQSDYLNTLKEFIREAIRRRSASSVLDFVGETYKRLLPDSCFCLYLLDERKRRICRLLHAPNQGCDSNFPTILRDSEQLIGAWIRESDSRTIVPQSITETRGASCGSRTLHYIPVDIKGGPRLLLTVCSSRPEIARPPLVGFIDVLTYAAFLSFERARVAEEAVLLTEIATLANQAEDRGRFLKAVVLHLKAAFSAVGCSIFVYDERNKKLTLGATTGLQSPQGKPLDSVEYALGEGLTGWTAEKRKVIRLFNALDETERLEIDPTGNLKVMLKALEQPLDSDPNKLHQFLSLPISLGVNDLDDSKLIGVLRLYKKKRAVGFFPHDEQLASTVCKALAPAIERWSLIEHESKLTQGLLDVIQAMHSEENLAKTLRTIVRNSMSIFNGCAAALFRRDPADDKFGVLIEADYLPAEGYADFPLLDFKLNLGQGLVGKAAKSGSTIAVADVSKDPDYVEALPKVQSAICTPIVWGGECRGVLNVDSDKIAMFRPGDKRTIRIIEAFANQAAIVLHRAEVVREQAKYQQNLVRTTELLTAANVASGLAHELKNGLAAIAALADTIETDPAIKSRKVNLDKLSTLRQQANNLFNLAKRLMDLSKVGVPVKSLVYLNEVVEETMALLDPVIRDKGMIPGVDLDPSLSKPTHGEGTPVLIDEKQITQVLTNLVFNAIDASHARQRIEIKTRNISNEQVEFSVRDFGGGIAPQDKPHIFELFYTTKDDGFGVGLHVANFLLREHGGQLEFVSKPHSGTTFSARLPKIKLKKGEIYAE